MNILKRLDMAISLLESGKSSAEIKGHLVAIREEIEANSHIMVEHAKLKKAHTALQKKHLGLQPSPEDESMCGGSDRS